MILLATLLGQAGQAMPHRAIFWPLIWNWLPCIFGVTFYGLLAVCIWKATKYFGSAAREQKLLRMEMGKLAEEVHLLRQELAGCNKRETSNESG
jgi:hypothetical protein